MAKKQLNKKELEEFRQIILNKRVQILKDISESKERAEEMMNTDSTNAIYSSHMADAGSDQQEREKAYYWLSRENNFLQYLNRALAMIDDGTFGICNTCGDKIDKERLMEVPHTTQCFQCKNTKS